MQCPSAYNRSARTTTHTLKERSILTAIGFLGSELPLTLPPPLIAVPLDLSATAVGVIGVGCHWVHPYVVSKGCALNGMGEKGLESTYTERAVRERNVLSPVAFKLLVRRRAPNLWRHVIPSVQSPAAHMSSSGHHALSYSGKPLQANAEM